MLVARILPLKIHKVLYWLHSRLNWLTLRLMAWREYKRTDAVSASGAQFISFRAAGISFSAGFVHVARLDKVTRASILVDDQRHRIGFKFHNRDSDTDSYAVVSDGGGGKRAKAIQNSRIYAQFPWLAAILKASPRDRRFEPQRDEKADVWFVEVSRGGKV